MLGAVLLMLLLAASPVLASDTNVDIQVSDIEVDGSGLIGYEATASGTATVTAYALDTSGNPKSAYAEGQVGYSVTDPDGYVLTSVSQSDWDAETNYGWLWVPAQNAEADVSLTLDWSFTFVPMAEGNYVVEQSGEGLAWYLGLYNAVIQGNSASYLYTTRMPQPRPNGPAYPDWYPSPKQFTVFCGGPYTYSYADYSTRTLPAIELTTTCWWNGQSWRLRVVIPEGTQVAGENCLRILMTDTGVKFTAYSGGEISFSKPVTVYEFRDGAWSVWAKIADFASS